MQKQILRYLAFFLILATSVRAEWTLREDFFSLEKSFVFVIPSYNNSKWYEKNLNSVFAQSYKNFRVIYVDDASPDNTGALVQAYIEKYGLQDKITLIRNEKRVGALANIYKAVSLCSPHEIVVNLDGDDWLAHRDVLAHLKDVYADSNVWLTYGQFIYYPSYEPGIGCEIPSEIIEYNTFRVFTRGTTALRTFYAGLFHKIKKEDLLYQGEFFKAGYDLAIMFPMLEMAGWHIRFVPEVSYVYNINTPINDHKINFEEQANIDHYLRAKPKYQPLLHYNQKRPAKTVYITPGLWGELFSIDNPLFNRDNTLEVLYKLREVAKEEGFDIRQANSLTNLEDFEYLVLFEVFKDQIQAIKKYPKEKCVLFLWEPPSVLPENYNSSNHEHFSRVYTWNDALVDNQKYFKFHYPVIHSMVEPIHYYFKRLAALVACNKESSYPGELYSERRKVINFFEKFCCNDFDLYGKGWPTFLRTYQGPIGKKVDYLKYYRFCFAYENVKGIPGYVTEKIFDCFHAGTVPIYWGAPNIKDYVPKSCFIAREDFGSEEELYQYLRTMSESDYNEYIKNIQSFLKSQSAQKFSIPHFITTFMNLLLKETP